VMYKKLNFDPAAFEPLAIMTSIPNTLVVRTDFPANSVQELIAYAKANPGKVNFGSQGVGTTPHLTGELFARVTGTKLTHVPYRGTAQAVNDLIAGHLDLLFFQLDSVREQYQAKRARSAAEDAGRDRRQAQCRHQRGAQAAGDGRASARHEHDPDRRRARRDQGLHPGRDRALGRRDPRREHPRGVV
jgi:hypothetical protein